MLYKDIDKESARQCCREYTVFNDRKHREAVCDKCPLRREFKDTSGNTHQGICWFILMRGLTDELIASSPYAQMEKLLLEEELVSYPLEWLEWLKTHKENENGRKDL